MTGEHGEGNRAAATTDDSRADRCPDDMGIVFKQNVATMCDSLYKEVAHQSAEPAPKVAPLLVLQRLEPPKMEVPFSSFVGHKIAQLSGKPHGDCDDWDASAARDKGFRYGKLVSKPKSRMEVYRVNQNVFNFACSNIDVSLKALEVRG